jgi:predicted protein tyrosine phosphatase
MYIETLGRQMAVCSFEGAARLVNLDQGYWNVISIHGPHDLKARLPRAKSVFYACFDDIIEDKDSAYYRAPRAADLDAIFNYAAGLPAIPTPAPLLIHCQQGISRSTAVALVLAHSQLPPTEDRAAKALEITLTLRPQAVPNRLVLQLGFARLMPPAEASRLADGILRDPRVEQNRFQDFPEDSL